MLDQLASFGLADFGNLVLGKPLTVPESVRICMKWIGLYLNLTLYVYFN